MHFLMGCPHSGKSTYANNWVKTTPYCEGDWVREPGPLRPRVVISGDDFRYSLTGHEYLPHSEMIVSSFMDVAILALLNRGFDVLVDDTSSSEMTLLRYFRLHSDPVPIFMDTPPEVCKERALANNRPYLLPVIDRIAKQLDHVRNNWEEVVSGIKEKVEHRLHTDVTV